VVDHRLADGLTHLHMLTGDIPGDESTRAMETYLYTVDGGLTATHVAGPRKDRG